MNRAIERPSVSLTQRLWLLERRPGGRPMHSEDVSSYTNAVLMLDGSRVRVLFVRSSTCHTSDEWLKNPVLLARAERDARPFESLDAALAWTQDLKTSWIARGWREVSADARDR